MVVVRVEVVEEMRVDEMEAEVERVVVVEV